MFSRRSNFNQSPGAIVIIELFRVPFKLPILRQCKNSMHFVNFFCAFLCFFFTCSTLSSFLDNSIPDLKRLSKFKPFWYVQYFLICPKTLLIRRPGGVWGQQIRRHLAFHKKGKLKFARLHKTIRLSKFKPYGTFR